MAQRFADDLHPALGADLARMWEMSVCTVRLDKNMPRAISDVESPRATRAAILTSVGVSAPQPEAPRCPRGPRTPRLMP